MGAASYNWFLRMPFFAQNMAVTGYDLKAYRIRRGGAYQSYRSRLREWDGVGIGDLKEMQAERLRNLLCYAVQNSPWYAKLGMRPLNEYPILTKDDLVDNVKSITTTEGMRNRVTSYTGGTTGASLKVYYRPEDIQERAAFLDHFRAAYGHELGLPTAWFSGKAIASAEDVARGRCYRDDLLYNIRYFSTFHINEQTASVYWQKLMEFAPRFIVGFPSSVFQICRAALERGDRAPIPVTAFFPTAETMLPLYRDVISEALGCVVKDQYASSEGAPFIFECSAGAMHMHPMSGIFEVVDKALQPADEGELLVTSFSTRGTPLIRYRIGDRVRMAPFGERCACGSSHPLVAAIDGRTSDFVLSPTMGRINLGNLSNCTKGVEGIRRFQVIQDRPGAITVKVVPSHAFDDEQETVFLNALRARTGVEMTIDLERVENIPVATSGKYRIVVNNIALETR